MDNFVNAGETLEIIAAGDDKTRAAQAKVYLDQFNSPEAKEFDRNFEAAVALDPYWRKKGNGFVVSKGAVHQTPEQLVAAYRRNAGR